MEKQKEERINDLLDYSLRFYLFKYGIKDAYNSFKMCDNDIDFLLRLLSLNYNYLNDAYDNIDVLSKSIDCKYKRIALIDAIKMSYYNIASVLQSEKDFDFSEYISEGTNIYTLTRIFSILHDLVDHFELFEIEKTGFATIMRAISWKNNKDKLYKFLIPLAISTIKEGETWFLECIRDWDFFHIFDKNLLNFITFYLFYLSKLEKSVNKNVKDSIDEFLDSPSEGLNTDGSSWKTVFRSNLRYNGAMQLINNIDTYIGIYKMFPDYLFQTYVKQFGCSVSYSDNCFSLLTISRIWLEFVLFSNESFELDLEGGIESLFEKIKMKDELIIFVQNDIFNNNIKPYFFLWLNDDNNESQKFYYASRIESLKHYVSNFNIKKIELLDKEILPNLLFETKESITKYMNKKSHFLLDSSIKMSLQNLYTVKLDKDFVQHSDNIDKLCDFVYEEIVSCIVKEALNNLTRQAHILNKDSRQTISELLRTFKPIYKNCPITPLNIDTDVRKNLSLLKVVNCYFKDMFFYWKDDGLLFNISFSNRSGFKKISTEQVYKLIDNEYECINGLYRYEENGLIALLTHEELTKKIAEKYYYFVFVYDYQIISNPEKIVCLKLNDLDE